MQQCNNAFCELHPKVISLELNLQFVYFKFHVVLLGNCDRDKIIFLHCDFRSFFGHQQMHIQRFENQNTGAERVFLC